MPIEVQVAFQGGGAKFPALLAVADALRKAESDQKIKITRVAGSSAGSIAASVLACKPDFKWVVNKFSGEAGQKVAEQLKKPSNFTIFHKVIRGKPISSLVPLGNLLREFFEIHEVEIIADLKTTTLIPYTDLEAKKTKLPETDCSVSEAICDSCSIPFYFKSHQGSGRIDSGVTDNLPINLLQEESDEFGEVLAISFVDSRADEAPGKFGKMSLDYFLKIIEASITAQEKVAISKIRDDAVFLVKTELSTFDFNQAILTGFGANYRAIKLEAENWISEFCDNREKEGSVKINHWREENETAQFLMRQANKIYENLERDRYWKLNRVIFEAFAPGLRNENPRAKDVAQLSIEFELEVDHIHAMYISLLNTDPVTEFEQIAEFSVRDRNRSLIKTVSFPLVENDNLNHRKLGIFFENPITQELGPYKVTYKETGYELLKSLRENGEEEFCYTPSRCMKNIGRVELIAYIPKEASKVKLKSTQDPVLGRKMKESELPDMNTFVELEPIGWVVKDMEATKDGCQLMLYARI